MLLRCLLMILFSNYCFAEYQSVQPDYQFNFPKDHGSHENYPMEWWYFTGHLNSATDRTYGFEITVFRIGVDDFRESKSPWKSKNLFIVHTALTDDWGEKYYHQEELIRENF
ncbi:MAG: lipocalin-like domain-containing protein, partial [Candidatus Paceibacterota bacterium]